MQGPVLETVWAPGTGYVNILCHIVAGIIELIWTQSLVTLRFSDSKYK